MGCVFCASGLDGVVRNLTTGEIVEQMLRLQRLLSGQAAEAAEGQTGDSGGTSLGAHFVLPQPPNAASATQSDTQERLSHIVVMGMGEPLANLDRLLPAQHFFRFHYYKPQVKQ